MSQILDLFELKLGIHFLPMGVLGEHLGAKVANTAATSPFHIMLLYQGVAFRTNNDADEKLEAPSTKNRLD